MKLQADWVVKVAKTALNLIASSWLLFPPSGTEVAAGTLVGVACAELVIEGIMTGDEREGVTCG